MKRLAPLLLLLGFATTIFGAKLALIEVAGSDLPLYDQWDGEAAHAFLPWLEHHLAFADLVTPHNEHRIVVTKLLALGLLAANGQWSPLLEMVVNALLHIAFAVCFLLTARRWLTGAWLTTLGGVLLALFVVPFAWENTVFGFQSQFYVLLLFSLGHLVWSLSSDRFCARWALGQICALLALASMASGFFSSLAVLAVLGLRFLIARRLTAQQLTTAALALAVVVVGWMLRVDVPGHAPLRAHTLTELLFAFAQLMAWPSRWYLPLLLAPLAWAALRVVRQRSFSTADPILLGLALWSLLQCAALAYARGAGTPLSSRYLDLLTVHLALALILLVRHLSGRTRLVATGVWLGFFALCLGKAGLIQWRACVLPKAAIRDLQQENVRRYLLTGDPVTIAGKTYPDIPYPHDVVLLRFLASPELRSILPPGVRRPLDFSPTAPAPAVDADSTAFPPGTAPAPGPVAGNTFAPSFRSPWTSPPFPAATLPLLRFRVIGDLGPEHPALRVVAAGRDSSVALEPDRAAGLRWKTVTIPRPDGPWRLIVTDDDPAHGFALTAPVEVGRLTWLAEKIIKTNRLFFATGLALLLVGGWLGLVRPALPGRTPLPAA